MELRLARFGVLTVAASALPLKSVFDWSKVFPKGRFPLALVVCLWEVYLGCWDEVLFMVDGSSSTEFLSVDSQEHDYSRSLDTESDLC